MTQQEKDLLDYLVNDSKDLITKNQELGYDYFMELCAEYDVNPTTAFVDTLMDYGIYIESRMEAPG